MSRTDVPPQTSAGSAPTAPVAAPPAVTPAKWQSRRRRPGMLAAAVACIAACAVGNYWYWTQNGQRQPVIELARDVAAGSVIKDSDLREASVALDPSMKVVGIQQRDEVVGMRATGTLPAGALLHPEQVTKKSLVKAGEQLVGIALKPGQLPDSSIKPGDSVQVVLTGEDQAAATGKTAADPSTVEARVVRVGAARESTGERVVDVAVEQTQGPKLAARAAAGEVALAVDGAGG
ncbi:SAF domain-containing protein (plasmid) [Streptomyces sp. SDT5-1]|uniref:SAF domain-containing protein n=1 Tax=Streptomyces sp. SDT5-1 TaxID=3406418 RepID=UPI003FD4C01F